MKKLHLLKYIYLSVAIVAYLRGYVIFGSEENAYAAGYAILSAAAIYLFVQRVTREKYMLMKLSKIDQMSGQAFEEYLKVQFQKKGYRVSMTEASHDYGADLILKKGKKKIVVQAKRYDKNVGISAVQEAVGAVAYYEADGAMVVTNQYFTKSAYKLAMQNNIQLWTRKDLIEKFGARK